MANHSAQPSESSELPAPEVLRPQSEKPAVAPAAAEPSGRKPSLRLPHATYRPSHKATFIGLAVVAAILAVNAGIIVFMANGQASANTANVQGEVTLNSSVLDKLGVNRNAIGDKGTELVVGPDSRFKGKVTVGGDVNIAGQATLNGKLTASDASLTNLQAGDTSLGKLSVNGDTTVSNLNVRNDLTVLGSTRLQGPIVMGQLLTVNNNVNISGNLAIGGLLSARGFQASSLVSDTTLTVGGHVITRGNAPSVGPGGAVGANGTVSISGNDASGTVAVNVGTGGGGGMLAQIAFRAQYGSMPHVVVTAVGRGAGDVYVNRSVGGFSISTSDVLAPGGYVFDYIVMQ